MMNFSVPSSQILFDLGTIGRKWPCTNHDVLAAAVSASGTFETYPAGRFSNVLCPELVLSDTVQTPPSFLMYF
jgi:hypothetical protein